MNSTLVDDIIVDRADVINSSESSIDKDEPLYLLTWSPNPLDLPQCDFKHQHLYNIHLLADYLKSCSCGLICVESTQIGNPHYHGWYQLSNDPSKEEYRIAIVKTLQHFGNLKITKSKGHYRINSYSKHANCLHYYKKDMVTSMLLTPINPIHKDSKCDIDWKSYEYSYFFRLPGKRQSIADLEEKQSLRDFYIQFYTNSIN